MKYLTLGELTANTRPICYGVLKPGPFTTGGIPLVRVTDISKNSFDESNLYYISQELDQEFKRSRLNGGEILLSIQGTVGKVAICPKHFSGANISRTIAVIEPDERVHKDFLRFYLVYMDVYDKHYSTGSTRASLNISYLRQLEIPLPPLKEQKKIAAILDAADDYRQKTKALNNKYDQLTQSLFLDMFGDPVTNPKGWDKETLKNGTNKIGSGATPRGGKEAYKEEGISLIRSLNIHDNWFKIKDLAFIDDFQANELNGVIVKANDVMFNITGASVCRCCIVPQNILPARVNQHVAIIRAKTEILNSTFLLHCFLSQNVKSHLLAIGGMGGATREALTKSDLESFKTIIPPIRLQNQFAERVTQIEKQKQQAEASLVKAEELFSSLLQRAFKGELTS